VRVSPRAVCHNNAVGLTIYYKGKLNDPSKIGEVIEAIDAFCKRVGWKCKPYSEQISGVVLLRPEVSCDGQKSKRDPDEEPWPEPPPGADSFMARVSSRRPPNLIEETIRGVIITVAKVGQVQITFDSTGRLCRYMEIPDFAIHNAIPETSHWAAMPLWADTTGAVELHVGLCALFRMLQDRYIDNLKISDETGYWKAGNLKRLREHHMGMSALIGIFNQPENLNVFLEAAGLPPVKKVHNPVVTSPPPKKPKRSRPVS
jgi:hypothetical protein